MKTKANGEDWYSVLTGIGCVVTMIIFAGSLGLGSWWWALGSGVAFLIFFILGKRTKYGRQF